MQISKAGTLSESSKGFTLVELAVVITLLALLSLWAVPLFHLGETGDLMSSARRFNGVVKYLFNESVLSGKEYRLILDLDRHSYRAKVVNSNNVITEVPGFEREIQLQGEVLFADVHVPGRGSFRQGQVTLYISPSGWIDEALIHLQNQNKSQSTLHVQPLTGTTEVHEGYKYY